VPDTRGLRESIAFLRALLSEGIRDLNAFIIDAHLCFLAKRRLDMENLRKSLARVELVMQTPDVNIDAWIIDFEEVEV